MSQRFFMAGIVSPRPRTLQSPRQTTTVLAAMGLPVLTSKLAVLCNALCTLGSILDHY
jgi:hypothetical protein